MSAWFVGAFLLGGGEGISLKSLWQSDWVHKTVNVLDALLKPVHRKAKKAIREATGAEVARVAVCFADEFGAKWSKVGAEVVEDKGALVVFYELPAGRCTHLRTTNPVLLTFAPVKVRTPLRRSQNQAKLLEVAVEKRRG